MTCHCKLRTHQESRTSALEAILGSVVLVCLVPFAGCGSSHGTQAVTGTVLYKDQPIVDATVNFLPKSEKPEAKSATGRTDASGHFTLTTYFGPDQQPAGALPGEYIVTVTKIDEPQGAYDPHKDPPLKNHLPVKYGAPQKSPLTAEVKTSGSNHFELKLAD